MKYLFIIGRKEIMKMAYNSYFPTGYQQMIPNYQQQFQNVPQAQNNAQNGMIWVQGVEGAKAYPVAAGSNVLLMDSEESLFYIKSTDQSGMPMPLRIFQYSEISNNPTQQVQPQQNEQVDLSGYVTKEEFEARLKELTAKKSAPKKKEVKEDE